MFRAISTSGCPTLSGEPAFPVTATRPSTFTTGMSVCAATASSKSGRSPPAARFTERHLGHPQSSSEESRMGKYGRCAEDAVDRVRNRGEDPVTAWANSARAVFPHSESSQKKGYRGYALKAVDTLKKNPTLSARPWRGTCSYAEVGVGFVWSFLAPRTSAHPCGFVYPRAPATRDSRGWCRFGQETH